MIGDDRPDIKYVGRMGFYKGDAQYTIAWHEIAPKEYRYDMYMWAADAPNHVRTIEDYDEESMTGVLKLLGGPHTMFWTLNETRKARGK